MEPASIDKVRILIVGDSGVGKTSLVHLICQGAPIGNPYWTIGCSVDVKLHEYKAGTPSEKTYFLELWDVGGWSAHSNSRSIFYNPVHGIILVHDLTNRKSQQNLRKWLAEVLNKDSKDGREDLSGRGLGRSPAPTRKSANPNSLTQRRDLHVVHRASTRGSYDPEQFADTHIPVLVIGSKLDLAETVRDKATKRASSIAEECGADEINLDCTQVKHLAPGSGNAVKLSRFFDKVIERKYYSSRESMGHYNQIGGAYADRRRPLLTPASNYPHLKSSHVD